ncbi:MAG: hypothetical protein A2086_04785 [Spirochaetes bacterium GWD1_27_9]|nr:MAG: hypothetical protein A2Z98_07735 [Spirochaetes bacterium GWB1_27_13]OHD25377.1 MAG: hypothetical protein A2Y34_10950 [Spirochaetes bacterium GWC1_27_15]OHD30303.1 MAG: hypothetical protein A2086_04785 [Spirochaetes bacterium GWD1_27_9]
MIKKTKNNIFKFVSWLIALFFGVTGFAACYGPPTTIAMYGVSYASYKVSGIVKDSTTKQGIRGIKLSLTRANYDYPSNITTDINGSYSLNTDGFPVSYLLIKAKDIDGAENGLFIDKDLTIDINEDDYKNGDNEFKGEVDKTIDIELEPVK